MKNNTAQKILITGVRRTPGSIVYIRKVSGDLNEICMSDAKRAPAQRVVRIIVQVNFHRTPGYLYYVDSDGDVACVKRGLRGPAKQKKQPRGAKRPPHVQPQPQKPAGGTDYIALVLDDSGSMSGIASAAHRAFNGIIDGIIAESVGRSVFVSLYKFGSALTRVHGWVPAAQLKRITSYTPRQGATRLFDATGMAIDDMRPYEPSDPKADVAFLLHVITDGDENASTQHDAESLRRLMSTVQSTDRYTLTFMLPPGAKAGFCSKFGIPDGNVEEWERTTSGVERSSTATQTGMSQYMAQRQKGVRSVKTFYTTNASAIDQNQLRSTLQDIAGQVYVWQVKAEADLRDFCELLSGAPLLKGAAFYQLTKPEKNVQAWKRLLIRRKGSGEIYAGHDDVRRLLGLPAGCDVGVNPGNHGDYDIFVQSASVNRKLVRGTDVIYWPAVGVPFTEGASAPAKRSRTR